MSWLYSTSIDRWIEGKKAFNFELKFDIEKGLKETINWPKRQ